jgi:hypothetical protein
MKEPPTWNKKPRTQAPFQPRDPAYQSRVRASFARQRVMARLGVAIARLAAGEIALALPL